MPQTLALASFGSLVDRAAVADLIRPYKAQKAKEPRSTFLWGGSPVARAIDENRAPANQDPKMVAF